MEPNPQNLIQLEITSLTKIKKTTWWDNLFKKKKSESYCLELDAKAGEPVSIKLPIIIGDHEAMTMAIVLEGMKPKTPLTVDLFKNATDAFGYKLDSIVIDKVTEGIFLTTMRYSGGEKNVEVLARVSDAVTMALKYEVPIYVTREIVEIAGVQTT